MNGLYQVSNLGNVRSLNYNKTKKIQHLKKVVNNKRGYLAVGLSKNGIFKIKTVHRLVAETFISNPNNLPQVNHIDENKLNNSVTNLEWCTNKYNINYGTRKERISEKKGRKIIQLDKDDNIIKVWNGTCHASRELKINEGNIWEACNNKRKTAGKYKWKYKEEK